MQYLDYERLDVYRHAMSLVLTLEAIIDRLPSGRAYLIDQLRRASTSVVLNIAEGSGEHAPAEKSRFYRMAKRSGIECASIIEICLHLRLIDEDSYRQAREQVIRISAMLTKMTQAKPMPLPVPMPSSRPIGE